MSFVINKINHHKPQDYNTVKHSIETTVMPTDVSVIWATSVMPTDVSVIWITIVMPTDVSVIWTTTLSET